MIDSSEKKIKVNKGIELCLLVFLLFSLSYYIYRYPLSFNDTSTSPTYSDTPIIFQITKYVIAIIFLLIAFFQFLQSRIIKIKRQDLNIPVLFSIFFIVIYLLKIPFANEGKPSEALKTIYFLPLIILGSLTNLHYKIKFLIQIIFGYLLLHFIFDLYQIANFFHTSRLPALAVPGSIFIRFGGMWDDPNGLSIFLLLPYAFTLNNVFPFQKRIWLQRLVSYFLILSTLFLTISITGFFSFFCVTLIHIFRKRKFVLFYVGIFSIILFLIFLLSNPFLRDLIQNFIASKKGSTEGHFDLSYFKSNLLLGSIFGDFQDFYFHESFYLQFFINFGAPALLLLFILIFLSAKNCLNFSYFFLKNGWLQLSNFYSAIYLFIVGFAISNINLPFFSIYPVNYLFWFFLLISSGIYLS